jgi:Protein of unknown function (DUF3035)
LIVRCALGIGVSIAALSILTACARGTVQDALGMGKRSPDEFSVVSRAPLVLPPDYGLRPPGAGESRPGVDTPAEQARASLTGGELQQPTGTAPTRTDREMVSAAFDERGAAGSSGERALVAEATTAPVDPQIRRRIAEENMQLAEVEQALFTRLVKWTEPNTLAVAVDPVAETERLRTNRAEGKPPTEGESPVITQRRQSVLQGWLSEVF